MTLRVVELSIRGLQSQRFDLYLILDIVKLFINLGEEYLEYYFEYEEYLGGEYSKWERVNVQL